MKLQKKDEMSSGALTEALGSLSYMLRHRGPLTIGDKEIDRLTVPFLKRTLHIDNRIPALIEDVFSNRHYEQKDGTKPVLIHKEKTGSGWSLIWQLPPGVSFGQVKKDLEYFQTAANAWIELIWANGHLQMKVQSGELPTDVAYEWNPETHKDKILPIPVGCSRRGQVVFDLVDGPHMLIGGSTNTGKTNIFRCFIHALLPLTYVYIIIIDLKRLDFGYLKKHCLIAGTDSEALRVLIALNEEYDRRINRLYDAEVEKIQNYQGEMPYLVVFVDELAELPKGICMELLDRLVRLARAVGISIVVGSQRTSTKVIPGDTRANFLARLCFQVATPADSRVILGEDCGLAGELPAVRGRCIWRYGLSLEELQGQNLPISVARSMLPSNITGRWECDVRPGKYESKRLTAR